MYAGGCRVGAAVPDGVFFSVSLVHFGGETKLAGSSSVDDDIDLVPVPDEDFLIEDGLAEVVGFVEDFEVVVFFEVAGFFSDVAVVPDCVVDTVVAVGVADGSRGSCQVVSLVLEFQ